MKRYYVYSRYIGSGCTGKEDCCGMCDSWEQAIEKITSLYNINRKSAMKGQYYYFVVERG